MLGETITLDVVDRFRFGAIEPALLDPRPTAYFPQINDLEIMGDAGPKGHNKLHLNNRNRAFLSLVGPWRDLWTWLRSDGFHDWSERVFGFRGEDRSAQFEFSALSADGGRLTPHTDKPKKLLTLVIYCGGYPAPTEFQRGDGTWQAIDWGINRMSWMIRNDESWHRVGPLAGPRGQWRRTVTINLMRRRCEP